MPEQKTKKALIDFETVRIVEADDLNVLVERLEKSVHPTSKAVSEKWRNKGYYRTIQAALRAIVRNELLIDKDVVEGLESYLNEVVKSNNKVLKILDEI